VGADVVTSSYLADLNPRAGTQPGNARPVLVIQTDLLNDVGHRLGGL
jgi:mRNA-degrading endonuclease toxin of MazEF toxin-antitoxin module